MIISQAFREHLLSVSAVTDLIEERVRYLIASQRPQVNATGPNESGDELPYIVLEVISNPREQSLTSSEGLAKPRLQVNCHGRTYMEAHQVADAVRNCCDGYRGIMGGVQVDSCLLDDDADGLEASPGLDGARSFVSVLDFLIFHQESTPDNVPVLV